MCLKASPGFSYVFKIEGTKCKAPKLLYDATLNDAGQGLETMKCCARSRFVPVKNEISEVFVPTKNLGRRIKKGFLQSL